MLSSARLSVSALLGGAAVLLAPALALAEDEVRIAIQSGPSSVTVAGLELAIFDAEVGDAIYRGPKGKTKVRLAAKGDGVEVIGPGVPARTVSRVLIEAKDAVWADKGVYFGRLEVGPDPEGKRGALLVLNRLPLETYLLGIVGSEMSPAWPIESLKAQAVAARTYAMQRRMMMRAANKPYDLAATVLSQVYKGAERIRPSVIEAVKTTRGEVIGFDHELVEALFHSTCGGETISAKAAFGHSVPYLQPKKCQWCKASNRYQWALSFPLSEISSRLERARLVRSRLEGFERGDGAGKVSVKEKKGQRALSPKEVRAAIGYGDLYSDRFSAKTVGKKVVIEGKGFGHGVGMCQWGARGMAEAGKSYRQILEHYYAGAHVRRAY
jgi:stage II sporulation protein D